MLDFVYYPVSGILWFWHTAFGAVLGPDNGITWAAAVVFLVVTVRAALYKPFVGQVRQQLVMKELQPRIAALQKTYPGDRVRQASEMQKLRKQHGVRPLLGLLPMLAQAPVFIGLFHVLRSFDRTGNGYGQLGLTAQDNARTANYFFSPSDVQSFLDARLFGAPISASLTSATDALRSFEVFGEGVSVWTVAAVVVPLMLIAGIATHFNSRASIARQDAATAASPQTAIMSRLMLWVLPAGVLVGGPVFPIAVLLYWVVNNVWTYGQQHIVYRRIDAEQASKPAPTSTVTAPRPGAKPRRPS